MFSRSVLALFVGLRGLVMAVNDFINVMLLYVCGEVSLRRHPANTF